MTIWHYLLSTTVLPILVPPSLLVHHITQSCGWPTCPPVKWVVVKTCQTLSSHTLVRCSHANNALTWQFFAWSSGSITGQDIVATFLARGGARGILGSSCEYPWFLQNNVDFGKRVTIFEKQQWFWQNEYTWIPGCKFLEPPLFLATKEAKIEEHFTDVVIRNKNERNNGPANEQKHEYLTPLFGSAERS